LSTGQPELAAPRLGQPGHFDRQAKPVPCGLGPNVGPGLCGSFTFLFSFIELEISKK
jgi:hypothetical protein